MADDAPLHLQACRPDVPRLTPAEAQALLARLDGWSFDGGDALFKRYAFPDFHRTMAFVNAVAWIAHQQDHHPDFAVGYGHCALRFNTHSVGGLSVNDFICAARVDLLLPASP